MKASEFAKFFDMTITREDHLDEDGYTERFYVVDDQGVFPTKELYTVDGLPDIINDTMYKDYVDTALFEHGFEYDPNRKKRFYGQAFEFLMKNKKDNEQLNVYYDIVSCILHPERIKDDVSPKDAPYLDSKVFFKGFFKREVPENVIKAIEKNEKMSLDEIIDLISTLPEYQIKGFNDKYILHIDLRNHMEYLEESVDTVHDLVIRAKREAA